MPPEPDPERDGRAGHPPLCFVVMPFGVKPDGQGGSVDFDAVYEELLAPAIREAGLEPLRADQELVGGLIHKPMYERLILADYAVADLTTANANVFYELGVRHAVRPVLDRAGERRRQARPVRPRARTGCCPTRWTSDGGPAADRPRTARRVTAALRPRARRRPTARSFS